MAHKPTIRIGFTFSDYNNNTAVLTMYQPWGLSSAQVTTWALDMIGRVGPISDAAIIRWLGTWEHKVDTPAAPSSTSDTRSLAGIFYRNSDIFESLWIPSPRLDLLETVGPYAGLRIDALRPDVATRLEALRLALVDVKTAEGSSWPGEYVVGGLAK